MRGNGVYLSLGGTVRPRDAGQRPKAMLPRVSEVGWRVRGGIRAAALNPRKHFRVDAQQSRE